MVSASDNPQVVSDCLRTEIENHRVVQVPCRCTPQIVVSRFGVIPKPNQPGKWCIIVDLSHPSGYSVNDGMLVFRLLLIAICIY